jgi:integrase
MLDDRGQLGDREAGWSILRDFFRWCVREGLTVGDPTVAIQSPKRRGVRRTVIGQRSTDRIIAAATRPRDRVAVEVLFFTGARKSELAGLRLRDYDPEACELTLTGKGGKVRTVPVRDPALRFDLQTYIATRLDDPGDDRHPPGSLDEYLLYPEKRGPSTDPDGPRVTVIWYDRLRPLSSTAMHRWWKRLVTRAGVEDFKLHEARHTAITEIVRDTGNLKLHSCLPAMRRSRRLPTYTPISTSRTSLKHWRSSPNGGPSVDDRMQNDSDRYGS